MLSFFATVPILIAVLLYILPFEKTARAIAITVQLALTCCAFYLFLTCKEGEIVSRIGNYNGVLGIILKADTLSSVFIILTSFIFLIVAVYSFNESVSRLFWFFLFIWQGLLNGIFLTYDLFNIFVLLEVVTIVVSVLIMFNRDHRSMYDGMVYLMVNTVAMQFFLFGTGYVYKLTGVLDMGAAVQSINTLDKSALILPYALLITSISLKCALMPLFSWLPKAHGTPGAPSAVSAILSGLHIKSGIYLFIRFQYVFHDITIPGFFLAIGIITGIAGFLLAISQSDMKLVLAYSTISQIGMIMIGLNVADTYSYTGSLYHIINHALFKSALFLNAGVISQAYGTRDINKIRGVFRRSPIIGTATVMSVLGITGAPFFNGSISKYFIMSGADWISSVPIIFINLGTIIVFIKYSAMLSGRSESAQDTIKIDICKQAATLILGFLCLIGGIFGEQAIMFLFNVRLSVDAVGYVEKIVLFALSGIAGYLLLKFYVNKSPLFKRIKEIDLSFRGICISMGVFFAVTLIVTGM